MIARYWSLSIVPQITSQSISQLQTKKTFSPMKPQLTIEQQLIPSWLHIKVSKVQEYLRMMLMNSMLTLAFLNVNQRAIATTRQPMRRRRQLAPPLPHPQPGPRPFLAVLLSTLARVGAKRKVSHVTLSLHYNWSITMILNE
jgi:hypothetical protein